ncbi:hypothetical protein DFS34DRAFT_618773 [Phlyctochytrium arcticum]|nr:hypothetical protein DFS34DRAFT_618773 [Phlyctochytrium arcticum]
MQSALSGPTSRGRNGQSRQNEQPRRRKFSAERDGPILSTLIVLSLLAHRKAQRKRELKKNKEDRKNARLVAAAQKDVTKLALELQEYRAVEATDPLASMKIRSIEDKVKRINQARAELGLPPVDMTLQAASKRKTKKQQKEEEDLKWYHTTFNPHGPKKPAMTVLADESISDDSDSSTCTDETGEESVDLPIPEKPKYLYPERKSGEPEPKLRHEYLACISLPEGKIPSYDAQIYHTLVLPEIRDKSNDSTPKSNSIQSQEVAPQATISRPPGPHPAIPSYRSMFPSPPFQSFPQSIPPPQSKTQPQRQRPYQVGNAPSDDASPVKNFPLPDAPTVIYAAPIVRDLRAESTRMVPIALRKRKTLS